MLAMEVKCRGYGIFGVSVAANSVKNRSPKGGGCENVQTSNSFSGCSKNICRCYSGNAIGCFSFKKFGGGSFRSSLYDLKPVHREFSSCFSSCSEWNTIPSWQFSTGGTGAGTGADPLASQGAVVLDRSNRLLFA